ncbi:glucose-6-phosphate isomerase [Roseomonas sp. PWR1]|uniref:Glucose-6-phosphate isomerase n=1 Tax=Roseomonas nitratireducens TaxID=2820810 RepID=A0ABS4ANG0_9PROT|nr:glucose-6-phosphate isomerase [Neoroseomonas nitratireducens]MBP0462418.1 glucose-6-phosphate isomerase [Neoroseomonas nitratireducens]
MNDADIQAAWAAVETLGRRPGAAAIRPLFAADPDRPARMTRRGAGLTLDVSRTAIAPAALDALLALARAADAPGFLARMARGELVNVTEERGAAHMALRAATQPEGTPELVALWRDAQGTLARMRGFAASVHDGTARGATGQRFTDVLNIGIGGSDLGPAMAARALWTPAAPLRAHFLGNVDAHAWEEMRARLDPARTLVLVASKTFTTQETMANAALARAWLVDALGEAGAGAHLAALSTNLPATAAFGVAPDRVFGFHEWIGGRFSLWSAIGLSLALALGVPAFDRLLEGARAMDSHALAAPPTDNLPLLLALTEAWHVNALGYPARAVLAYDERLSRFAAHLQQLEMESLGKGVRADGTPVPRATGAVVFGEPGTNAQHSFMQLLHQAPVPVPADIILVATPDHPHADSHRKLLANGLAQAEALLRGKDAQAVAAEMRAAGRSEAEIAALAPHRVFTGDRPSTLILLPRLDAFALGALVALYEHKVACLGALWGINPFDQWGVELGKQLAGGILPALEGQGSVADPATAATLAALRA